jgi:hypothetical protein
MKLLALGQLVQLASHPDLVFKITQVNPDFSYQVQGASFDSIALCYDNVPSEMLKSISV